MHVGASIFLYLQQQGTHNLRAASDGKRLNTVRRDFAGKLNGIIGIEIFQSFGVANG